MRGCGLKIVCLNQTVTVVVIAVIRLVVMKMRILLILSGVFLAVGVGTCIHHINTPRIIGRAVAPDGTEMCLVQKCNWSGELFTTSFFYKRPNDRWAWLYYDHQDDYWRSSRVVVDTNAQKAVFYRGNSPAVTFLWADEVYTLHRWNRTITGAQNRLPAAWSPGMRD